MDITSKGGKAVAIQANVAEPGRREEPVHGNEEGVRAARRAHQQRGYLHEFALLENVTPEHFHKQFNLNVLGLILATQEAAKLFGDKGGSVGTSAWWRRI